MIRQRNRYRGWCSSARIGSRAKLCCCMCAQIVTVTGLTCLLFSLLVPQLDFVSGLEESNVYSGDSCREAAYPKERMVRLSRELAGLRSLLPCTSSSSVFVRVDEQKLTLWQTMITGPDDTPYSGGCFLFDFYFPPSYPSTAPKVCSTLACV